MTGELSLVLVFAAGLLSFLSPCVLPLIPSYLSILGGAGLEQKPEGGEENEKLFRTRLVKAAAAFVFGFSAVFITLGILVSATFSMMGGISAYLNRAAGIMVIILGLNVIFDFFSFLNYEKRFHSRLRPGGGAVGAFAAGAAFAAGWTPCVGPVLTGILLLAGQSGKTLTAVFYLAVYSAGLGLPFILAAFFFDVFVSRAAGLRARLPLIRRISGIVLVLIGFMILFGRYSALNTLIQSRIFRYIDWAETQALPFRLFADYLAWLQKF